MSSCCGFQVQIIFFVVVFYMGCPILGNIWSFGLPDSNVLLSDLYS